MPTMIRPNNKAAKMAREILGPPQNEYQSKIIRVKREQSQVFEQNMVDINELNRLMGQNSKPSPY